jgi:Family of unknown function (DUF6228)
MGEGFVFSGSPPLDRSVTFSSLVRPHGDALTWLRVQIAGDGLVASCSIESLDGDLGLDPDSEATPTGVTQVEMGRLSQMLVELGSGPLWDGPRRWRTLHGELTVELVVDRTGHVDINFLLAPMPWQTTWTTSCALQYVLGDLVSTGHELRTWIDAQLRAFERLA